jgi:RNA-directed DNA polymerase
MRPADAAPASGRRPPDDLLLAGMPSAGLPCPGRAHVGDDGGPAPTPGAAGSRRRLTARPRRHPPAGKSPRPPRPFQPPVAQRHLKAEVAHCAGGVVSPLLANVALSALDEHFLARWDAHGSETRRRAHRRRGGATYRIVRYADDFVIMVCGSRAHAEALQGEVTGVLAPLGLRLSPSKTRVCHIDEGFDFLGFHIQRRTKRGTARKYVYTYPSKKALASIMDKVRTLTARSRHRALGDLLRQLNPALAVWCHYFRFGVSSATFGYLDKFVWRRITGWLRKRHKGITWKALYRRFLTGPPRGIPAEGGKTMFRAAQVETVRYRWRGTNIPAPWPGGAEATAAA